MKLMSHAWPSLAAALLLAASASAWAAGGLENNKAGLAHLHAGRYAEAEAEFLLAVQADPGNANFQNNVGVALQDQGKYEQSLPYFKTAIGIKDGVALYHKNLGGSYLALARLDEALDSYQAALRINPAEPNVHSRIVDIAFETGSLDKWLERFEDSIDKANPDTGAKGVNLMFLPEQAILYAYALRGNNDYVISRSNAALEALGEVKTTRGGYVVPIITPFFIYIKRVPKKTVNIAPITGSLYGYRGRAYLGKGLLDEAMADFQRSLEAAPRGSAGLGVAMIHLERGDAKEAAYQLRRMTEVQPGLHVAQLYYAAALHLTDDKQGAEEQFQRVVRRRGQRAERKGELEYVQGLEQVRGELDKAAAHYEQVIAMCPACAKAYRGLGEVRLKAGDPAKAAELLTKAASLIPDDQRTKSLLAAAAR